MGQSSKKKKRRNKGRGVSKDHALHSAEYSELISEELTALSAIFQEDCKIVSESQPQVVIKIRPYSKDTGYENLDVSADLLVRCLPGYPYKSPKLQLTLEKGLSESDTNRLLSLLYEQANSNAREGRVMIFNLVEAAQEFLSEIVTVSQFHNQVGSLAGESTNQLPSADSSETVAASKDSFVYGFIDLFSGCGESWNWNIGTDEGNKTCSSVNAHALSRSKEVYEGVEKNFKQKRKTSVGDSRHTSLFSTHPKLETVDEDSNDENVSTTNSRSLSEDLVETNDEAEKDKEGSSSSFDEIDDHETESSESSYASLVNGQISQTIKRDLMMAHLLRLACGSKGPMAEALPKIACELLNLGIFSECARDMAVNPSSLYSQTFNHAFDQHTAMSEISQFWEPVSDFKGQNSSLLSSRYHNDFEELQPLGHGGFGHVVLCKNKLDGRQYAVKMIRLKDKSLPVNDRILREVATLARLQHQHVVRYYQELEDIWETARGVQRPA